jgi:phosphate:Na+ symporter
MAGSHLVEALKAVKHLQKNLNAYLSSDNAYIRAEYDKLRALIGRVLREIEAAHTSSQDAVTILSLDDAKLLLAESDLVTSGVLDQLIRKRRISAQMATSLINDGGYVSDACENLINAAQILFAVHDPLQLATEQSVKLDDTEIEQIARST